MEVITLFYFLFPLPIIFLPPWRTEHLGIALLIGNFIVKFSYFSDPLILI